MREVFPYRVWGIREGSVYDDVPDYCGVQATASLAREVHWEPMHLAVERSLEGKKRPLVIHLMTNEVRPYEDRIARGFIAESRWVVLDLDALGVVSS